MKENRTIALDYILASEDGSLNLGRSEPGGASRWGVSVDLLTDYRRKQGQSRATVQDVVDLTRDDAIAVYGTMILDPLRFDELPSGVDYRITDIETNSGVTGGVNLVQLALGMWPLTGKMDDNTMARIRAADPRVLIQCLSAAWIADKHRSASWFPQSVNPQSASAGGYGHGWSNRNIAATRQALEMVK